MPLTKIQSLGITDGTIVAGDIASGAITAAKLASGVGGKVLQVITATDSTSRSTSSTSFVTGSNTLSVSITPAASANKVFVICTCEASVAVNGATFLTIFRDSTNLGNTNGMVAMGGLSSPSSYDGTQCSISVLDSPSTTSAITYQLYFRSDNASRTASINGRSGTVVKGSITAFEIKG